MSSVSEPTVVRVVRSSVVESVHLVDGAVVDADGRVLSATGDPDRIMFARSSMKPLQAAVSLSLAPFDFTDREVAVMCASHNAEPIHLETVRSLLERAGLEESVLQTPARRPMDEQALATAPEALPINSDCSGKHGGMLAACLAQGWPLDSYRDPGHPFQQAVRAAVETAAGMAPVAEGVDGCGLPVHAFPARALALIYARLAAPDRLGALEPHAARATGAMRAEPYLVAGRNRVDTATMQATPDLVLKSGAEALICAGVLGRGIGVALKVRDGTSRGSGPAMLGVLHRVGLITDDAIRRLEAFARPDVTGGGRRVGEVAAEVRLVGG